MGRKLIYLTGWAWLRIMGFSPTAACPCRYVLGLHGLPMVLADLGHLQHLTGLPHNIISSGNSFSRKRDS